MLMTELSDSSSMTGNPETELTRHVDHVRRPSVEESIFTDSGSIAAMAAKDHNRR
jgi:hypothetical protein